jgi:transposase-like protein
VKVDLLRDMRYNRSAKEEGNMARRDSPKLEFQVVLEVLTSDKTVGQVARAYGIHSNSVSAWKQTLLEKGPEIFAQDGTVTQYERRIAELEVPPKSSLGKC